MTAPRDALHRPLLWIAAIDVAISIPIGIAWAIEYRVAAPLPVVVLTFVRMLAWVLALAYLLEPVRAWQRCLAAREQPDDALLLAADASMQQTPRRFILAYGLGWALMMSLSALLSTSVHAGPAAEAAAALNGFSVLLALPAWLTLVFRGVLLEPQTALCEALLERSIRPTRPRIRLVKGIVVVFLSLMTAAMIGVTGAAVWFRAEGHTDHALVEQQRLAELDAQRIELTLGTLPRGDEGEDQATGVLVTTADLPLLLREHGDSGIAVSRVALDLDSGEVLAAAPIGDGGDGRWVLRSSPYDDDSWLFGLALGLGMMLCIIPGIVAGSALDHALTRPLAQLERSARQVAQQGRLRQQTRVVTLFDDELGDVADSFNEMLDVLEELAGATATVARGDLRVVLERPGDLQDAFRAMLAKLDEMVEQIRMTAIEVAAASAEIHAATQEQEQAIERESTSVEQLSSSVVSLATSAESITVAAHDVLANAEQTRTTTEGMAVRIGELRAQAEGIGELLELIGEVANRSDLLALNGSLEAVRAGEAGRGFELVAAEMRRLAERVTAAAIDVAKQVAGIAAASASTDIATAQSRALAESTAAAARRIFDETHRQSDATELLANAVEQVADIVIAASHATSHTRSTAAALRVQAMQLERLTRQFKLRGD
jgi:methyl-accepting chemotaxis protein